MLMEYYAGDVPAAGWSEKNTIYAEDPTTAVCPAFELKPGFMRLISGFNRADAFAFLHAVPRRKKR